MSIRDRLLVIQARIAEACDRSGRSPSDVTLVGVSKGHASDAIREALSAGLTDAGESYVQEWKQKRSEIQGDVRWHFIGHLQSKKAREVRGQAALIHSVDRATLIDALERGDAPVQDVLLQVNLAGEASKSGCAPEEVERLLDRLAVSDALRPVGLMTLPPPVQDPEEARCFFRRLRELRDAMQERLADSDEWMASRFRHLSMGMSHDLEVAVEEGATLVRVGTDLFGARA